MNEQKPQIIPSKSQCLKALREGLGPTARFQHLDGGGLAAFYTSQGSEIPVAQATPPEPCPAGFDAAKFATLLPWVVTRAAFRALGFDLLYERPAFDAAPRFEVVARPELVAQVAAEESAALAEAGRQEAPAECVFNRGALYDLALYDDVRVSDDGKVSTRKAVNPDDGTEIPEAERGEWLEVGKLAEGLSVWDARAQVLEAYEK